MPDIQTPTFAFTSEYNRLSNVLKSNAHICEAFDPAILKTAPSNHPPIIEFVCIWDTGASSSVITQKVVAECNLKPIGMTKVYGVNSEKMCNVYLINIILPNHVGLSNIRVTEGEILGADALIGMDIINQGDFAVTNYNNKTVFSFRIPSIERIDFVKKKTDIKSETYTKVVGRNEPCPCGSGKKYKKCCGSNSKALVLPSI